MDGGFDNFGEEERDPVVACGPPSPAVRVRERGLVRQRELLERLDITRREREAHHIGLVGWRWLLR